MQQLKLMYEYTQLSLSLSLSRWLEKIFLWSHNAEIGKILLLSFAVSYFIIILR